MKAVYRVEGSKCRHNHKSLKAAKKCMKEVNGKRIIASDDNGISWRVLIGEELSNGKS